MELDPEDTNNPLLEAGDNLNVDLNLAAVKRTTLNDSDGDDDEIEPYGAPEAASGGVKIDFANDMFTSKIAAEEPGDGDDLTGQWHRRETDAGSQLLIKEEQKSSLLNERKGPAPMAQADTSAVKFGASVGQESKLGQSQRKSGGLGKSALKKSYAGFDIGQSVATGDFFSSMRQRAIGEESNFRNAADMKGKAYVERLIEQQEDRYHKKFAFERGQYHQCIPNPQQEGQMITVQLVSRVLDGKTHSEIDQEVQDLFLEGQDTGTKEARNLSRQYQRYTLVPPDADEGELGKGEGEGEESGAKEIIEEEVAPADLRDSGAGRYGGAAAELYKDSALFEEVDQLSGIAPTHYANIAKSPSQSLAVRAYQGCKEFAVVAFWDLDASDRFACSRFFVIPNPMKRTIQDCEGTELLQVLYTSSHTNDVFFFFKGFEPGGGDDLDEFGTQQHKLQIAFIDYSKDDLELDGARHVQLHCKDFTTIEEGSVLHTFIDYLHDTALEAQDQLPNPTVIQTIFERGTLIQGKTVVFTAFLQQEVVSKDSVEGMPNAVTECWYPTIFFHDLVENRIVWEIFGAEQFIRVDASKKVTVLTNEIWTEIKQDDYERRKDAEEDFTRHWDFDDYVWKVRYLTSPPQEELQERDLKAPAVPTLNAYRLAFGANKDLEITEKQKVVETHVHNGGQRVTLIYKGLGAFTFNLKKAKSLVEASAWGGEFRGRSFRAQLAFSPVEPLIEGKGTDEDDTPVSVRINLRRADSTNWSGYYEAEDEMYQTLIEGLIFNKAEKTISAQWTDDGGHDCEISGTLGAKNKRDHTRKVDFTFKEGEDVKNFEGKVDAHRSRIKGTWHYAESPGKKRFFDFSLEDKVPGTLQLSFGNAPAITEEIEVDFRSKEILQAPGHEKHVNFYARDAVDQAKLCFFILQPDATFVRAGEDSYVQAKLNSIGEEDVNSNGRGVAESVVVLYKVSEAKEEESKKKKDGGSKKVVQEPRSRKYIKFYLNQSFLRTQEKKDLQLWNVNPSVVTADGRFFGSVIYEEYGTDELCLNFVTSSLQRHNDDDAELDYPQQPVPQSWMVDYPLLAYKTYTPRNREIAIVHMALNMPQRIIHLGEWEFVCFVNHTQMVEQKLFKKSKETNCDIMFLARRGRKVRLMSFKSNPWLQFAADTSTNNDSDIYKQAIFIFSGNLHHMPTESQDGEKIDEAQAALNVKRFSRRFYSDKIQNVQLITKTLASYEQYMLIIQYNDCIVQAALNKKLFKVICEPEAMLRRHLVRGYNEKVFYAESSGNAEKIFQIEFHGSKANEITKKEIFQLAGSWLVAFEADGECIENDIEEGVTQSLFVMDDQQKIYLLRNEDDVRFTVKHTIDFSSHKKLAEINALRDNDWAHVHVTERTLTFNETTYNFASLLTGDLQVPSLFFGEEKRAAHALDGEDADREGGDDDDDEDGGGEGVEAEPGWLIQSVQGMPLTTNVIAQCQRSHKEFCFVVKPAPGSRKISIVGYQQLHEIEQMLFVSNSHVLVKFRGGKAVTLVCNGCIVHQQTRVQKFLEQDSTVIGESQIFRGKKTVLVAQDYGDTLEKQRLVALQFDSEGLGTVVGSFEQYRDQMLKTIEKLDKVQAEMLAHEVGPAGSSRSALTQHLEQRVENKASGALTRFASAFKKKEKQAKLKIRYAKEFFVTERGEVIKMAAIVSTNPTVLDKLRAAGAGEHGRGQGNAVTGGGRSGYDAGTRVDFISVLSVASTEATSGSEFKVIVFHCENAEQQRQLVKETQFCVVGNYLCHRLRSRRVVWVTQLKDEDQAYIPANSLDFEADGRDCIYREAHSRGLSLKAMVERSALEHVQMTEVPRAYFTTAKGKSGGQPLFHNNVLQITVRSHGTVFDLDSTPIEEVDSIENIDQLQDPDTMVNTGFIMSASTSGLWEGEKFVRRIQTFTNEFANLVFQKRQDRYSDGTREHTISGMLFRTFSEIDLWQLNQLWEALESRSKLIPIDPQAILSTYEGHTIFSIFFDSIAVYELILAQLREMEFASEEDFDGLDVENGSLRRLYRALNLPTGDLLRSKAKRGEVATQQQGQGEGGPAWYSRCGRWVRAQLGITAGAEPGGTGFKSIMKKTLHFPSARFRESLMEIAMLCQENSVNNFVENLADIQVLFTSMSPATVDFFDAGFNETRFTKKIKNLDWKLGTQLQVLGQMNSVISEASAAKAIAADGASAEDVQNRQVTAKMLQIDWVFANYGGSTNVGIRELVVALAAAPHESLFSTELVITLAEHFWARYFRAVVLRCFLPFIVYFGSTLAYATQFSTNVTPTDGPAEPILRYLIIALVIYFAFFELVSMVRDGFSYLLDIFNYLDWSAFSLNFYLISYRMLRNEDEQYEEAHIKTTRSLAALLVILVWFKAFYWMRLFSATGFYVRLIRETLWDIRYFFILFAFILLTFANALLILGTGREEPLLQNFFNVGILNAVMNQYMLALGEFDTENYELEAGDVLVWFIFVATTFITQVTFLNMLIAIMGDTFDRVSEVKEQSALSEKIQILADYVIIVKRESVEKGTKSKFIFAITPKALGADEGGSWEGTVTQLKRSIDAAMAQVRSQLARKTGQITGQLAAVSGRLSSLDDKVLELAGNQQRLPSRADIDRLLARHFTDLKNSGKATFADAGSQTDGSDATQKRMSSLAAQFGEKVSQQILEED